MAIESSTSGAVLVLGGPAGLPGPMSTVPGPAGPASTVPGPVGPASTVPGPKGEPGIGINPKGSFASLSALPATASPGDTYLASADDTATPKQFLTGDGLVWIGTGGDLGPGGNYHNVGPVRGPPTTVNGKTGESITLAVADIAGAAPAASPTLTGIVTTQSQSIAGTQALVFLPIGNGTNALASHLVQITTAQATYMEFGRSVLMESVTGQGQFYTIGARVADFVGLHMRPGTGHGFAQNVVCDIEPGVGAQVAIASEIDWNNDNVDYGDASIDGSVTPYGTPLFLTGNGSKRASAAAIVDLGQGSFKTNRIFAHYNGTVRLNAWEGYSSCGGSEFWVAGTKFSALDCTNATLLSGQAIRMPNAKSLTWRNAANTADVPAVLVDGNDLLVLGGGANGVTLAITLAPSSDNSIALGRSDARFSAIWAANGTIQTSDARLKKDIADLPPALPILKALQPKTYRWTVGGTEEIEIEETQTVPLTEVVPIDVPEVEERDGQFFRTVRQVPQERIITQTYPLLDENGSQIVEIIPAQPGQAEERDPATGQVTKPAVAATPEQRILAWHEVPKTVAKPVKVKADAPKPGVRTHWGFLAEDVKAAFASTGRDFAGYVKGEDGTEAIRPDQLIPVLWKALQEEVSAREAMESRLSELETKSGT